MVLGQIDTIVLGQIDTIVLGQIDAIVLGLKSTPTSPFYFKIIFDKGFCIRHKIRPKFKEKSM